MSRPTALDDFAVISKWVRTPGNLARLPGLTEDAEKTVVNTLRQTITTCSDFNVLVKIGEQIKTEFSTGVQSAIREFYRAKHAVLKPKESANEPAN